MFTLIYLKGRAREREIQIEMETDIFHRLVHSSVPAQARAGQEPRTAPKSPTVGVGTQTLRPSVLPSRTHLQEAALEVKEPRKWIQATGMQPTAPQNRHQF